MQGETVFMQIYALKPNYKSLHFGSSNWKWEHCNSWQDVIAQKPNNVIRFNSSDLISFSQCLVPRPDIKK